MSTQQTPLAMALSKRKSDERATPLSAFRMARSWWLEGRRLNLSLLAEELGIGRATLMRWVGNKDLLMGEILWSLYKRIYDEAIARADQTPDLDGIDYLTQIYTDINIALINAKPMHDFLQAEPQWGLQLLTSRVSGLHERLMETWRKMFEEQIKAGKIKPEMDAESLALYIVKIGEGAIYCDLICARKPDPTPAATAFRLLVNGHQA
ncbi:QsdR family transcriptional regulator [Pseudomonas neustonica]|uniref:Transcriptional regulator n=1 Tax=Pseudomonas neustonica TaxID=2487346 RepID=A0ABX9XHV7_9PSED|nr:MULTISPECIES: QsdR family transcriptional regulator [Pseudomonas]MBA6421024.1 transcriptional regulator [Pseudomonas sp. 5Ae-yellow]ROZ82765.1 transcriptional regulator [Pseudomonas sp. SSM44]ROZ84717.1 transcriptional regulator [Pseudomonas neustonica]|tara:strand:- start:2047 stop:2670 length:624 start_codon:yes stop_codon:yes gene_type:complete